MVKLKARPKRGMQTGRVDRPPVTGLLTPDTFVDATTKYSLSRSLPHPQLWADRPSDAPALAAWAGFYAARAPHLRQKVDRLSRAVAGTLSGQSFGVPQRWPSEMTGLPEDDRHPLIDPTITDPRKDRT